MTRRASGLTLSFLLFEVLSGCGAGQSAPAEGFVANCTKDQAVQTLTSQNGAYTFYVCAIAAPAVGFDSFTYLVTDQSGAPQDGLTLAVQPWMPYMGHGSPGNGNATGTPSGVGQYQISNVVFQMAGEWQLRTTVSAPTPDRANPQFNIN
jgi:hypothetical protein